MRTVDFHSYGLGENERSDGTEILNGCSSHTARTIKIYHLLLFGLSKIKNSLETENSINLFIKKYRNYKQK